MYSNAIDASQFTPCEWYGHTFTIGNDPEVYDVCVDCGTPHEQESIHEQAERISEQTGRTYALVEQEIRWAADEQEEN